MTAQAIGSGAFSRRARFEAPLRVMLASGGEDIEWQEQFSRWAHLVRPAPSKGAEMISAGELAVIRERDLIVRDDPETRDIREAWRVTVDATVYDITEATRDPEALVIRMKLVRGHGDH